MSGEGISLFWFAYPLLFASGAALVYVVLGDLGRTLRARLQRETQELEEKLRDIFAQGVSARALIWVKFAGAPILALFLFSLTDSPAFALVTGFLAFKLPTFWLDRTIEKRRERIEGQVLDLINSLLATTKAGMNLNQSIEEIATRMSPPTSQEFAIVLQRVQAGQTLEAALTACDRRLNIPKLSLVLRSIIVNQQRGGPLPQLLEKISFSVRETDRVEERIKTETSGIKLSSKIMAAMPLLMCLFLYLITPDQVLMLFNTLVGNLILVVAGVLDYLGFTMIRRLGELEV